METKTNIYVKLIGENGNVFNLIALTRTALRRGGHGDLVKEFTEYVMASSSYEEALARISEFVIIE